MPASTDKKNLTPAQEKKLASVLATVKVKKDEATQKQLGRFGNKYLRFKLGIRGTGPHAHGFNADERKAITTAINEAFGIKAVVRKSAPAKAAPAKGKRGGKSAAALAKAQTERAQG